MTKTQIRQWNRMLFSLRSIANDYQTPKQFYMTSNRRLGLTPEEAIEMAYESIQEEAKQSCRGIREAKE